MHHTFKDICWLRFWYTWHDFSLKWYQMQDIIKPSIRSLYTSVPNKPTKVLQIRHVKKLEHDKWYDTQGLENQPNQYAPYSHSSQGNHLVILTIPDLPARFLDVDWFTGQYSYPWLSDPLWAFRCIFKPLFHPSSFFSQI